MYDLNRGNTILQRLQAGRLKKDMPVKHIIIAITMH